MYSGMGGARRTVGLVLAPWGMTRHAQRQQQAGGVEGGHGSIGHAEAQGREKPRADEGARDLGGVLGRASQSHRAGQMASRDGVADQGIAQDQIRGPD